MDFTGDEYNYYVNWVLHAILGMLREADGLMRSHGGPIRSMARKLRRDLGVPTRPLWRGLLLEPGEVPPDRMVPPRPRAHDIKSVSWSEDKEVGCWFADRDNDMAMIVRMQRPAVTGWMMKVTPQKQKVLWHWSWQDHFPAPRGPGTISLAVLASMHPHIDVTQFHWALQTQKEVILVPLNRAVAVVPYSEAGCPPSEDLNIRLGGPLRRNPKLRVEDDLFVFAGDEPIREAWDEVADENIMTVGPFPPILHYPGTHILYLFEDPDSKELFREIFTDAQREDCKRCLWQQTAEVPCCPAAGYEITWYDDDGKYIGPEKYDPDEGWEEFPECECKCECLYPPIFQNRQPIGGVGTINMFWDTAASKYLVGAVQFVASDANNNLMITHMAVKDPYRRNRINSFMIDQVVKKYPHRKLSFHDPTSLGRKFMESYGGEEWGVTAD